MTVFDEDGFEAFFPEDALAVVEAVDEGGHALFEDFHELGEVVHAVEEGLAVVLGLLVEAPLAEVGEVGGDFGDAEFGVDEGEAVEELLVGDLEGGFGRDFEKEVEVVVHAAVGEDTAA